jgi:serine/threonine protein kinase
MFCFRKLAGSSHLDPQQRVIQSHLHVHTFSVHTFFCPHRYEDSAPHSQIGTALFTAPEVFLNVQGHAYEGEAVDVWSCGVVSVDFLG